MSDFSMIINVAASMLYASAASLCSSNDSPMADEFRSFLLSDYLSLDNISANLEYRNTPGLGFLTLSQMMIPPLLGYLD